MRSSGVLMHISSLPGAYGIGTLGKEAYAFVDFLRQSGVRYWQVLPMGPTSYGDSPYQSFSSRAGNPYFIDLERLIEEGYLTREECDSADWGDPKEGVNYEKQYQNRFAVLRKAVERYLSGSREELDRFVETHIWTADYGLFMALKDAHQGAAWYTWDDAIKFRTAEGLETAREQYQNEILFYQVLQMWFFKQYEQLKHYANDNHVELIGDIPIYVAYDSVEVWKEPQLFSLNDDLSQKTVAGCPPDAFDANGQLWGNPIYRWDRMKEDGYEWWANRLEGALLMYDMLRIDHFRGFASFYVIPAEDDNAKGGHWEEGPGIAFFEEMTNRFGKMNIIAEDLGYITDDVRELLKATGYPGMKILQFAFGEENGQNEYLPHNYGTNCVCYPGTHDNDTVCGWLRECKNEAAQAKRYFGLNEEETYHFGMIRGAMASPADLAVIPMQDLLGIGNEGRMNKPSTIGCNWTYRMKEGSITPELIQKLKGMNLRYGRDVSLYC